MIRFMLVGFGEGEIEAKDAFDTLIVLTTPCLTQTIWKVVLI